MKKSAPSKEATGKSHPSSSAAARKVTTITTSSHRPSSATIATKRTKTSELESAPSRPPSKSTVSASTEKRGEHDVTGYSSDSEDKKSSKESVAARTIARQQLQHARMMQSRKEAREAKEKPLPSSAKEAASAPKAKTEVALLDSRKNPNIAAKSRKGVAKKPAPASSSDVRAAIKLQALFRGHLSRKVTGDLRVRTRSPSLAERKEEPRMASNRFEVYKDKPIGSGSFATVYKAFDHGGMGNIAVKVAHVGKENAASILKALEAEFAILKTLSHPNIVKVLHFDVMCGESRIFMEWMPGGSVQSVVRQADFRLHEFMVRKMAAEALRGLAFLHAQKIVHRDIKPGNMLVSGDGTVKLSDFGTSKTVVQASATSTQSIVGTPAYMPKEAIAEGRHSAKSDIWALGCSIVEMATGKLPWAHLGLERQAPVQLMFHIGTASPPNHCPKNPDHLSKAMKAILDRCFAAEPGQRPTAAELLESDYFSRADLPSDAESFDDFSAARPQPKPNTMQASASSYVANSYAPSSYAPHSYVTSSSAYTAQSWAQSHSNSVVRSLTEDETNNAGDEADEFAGEAQIEQEEKA